MRRTRDVVAELQTSKTAAPNKVAGTSPVQAVVQASPVTGVPSTINLREHLAAAWHDPLAKALVSPYARGIEATLSAEIAKGKQIFPPLPQVFSAFNVLPPGQVRVVIIGQDPYHDDGQAHGLCFSVAPGVRPPPSLVNIYKELATDIPGFTAPKHGTLTHWAKQGVLLLNATLTVEAHQPNSHSKIGWQEFTDDVIAVLNARDDALVFLLWGGFAQKKGRAINRARHRVIECAHPSPLSAKAWFGSRPFSKCNDALIELKKKPIDWQLPEQAEM